MAHEHMLEFSYTGPAQAGEVVEFQGVHEYAGCEIHVAASLPVDRSKIDTCAGDVVTTHDVQQVSFIIKREGEEQLELAVTKAATDVLSQNPRADYDDYLPQVERCRELAGVLFERGLAVTWYQTTREPK